MSKCWNQITIVGCGLIGASFALALRDAQVCERILGWDIDAGVLEEARARGIIDEVDIAFDRGGQSSSDLIYLATPVSAIIRFFQEHISVAKPGCLITDAGSTKVDICRLARASLPHEIGFIGGHPVAGSHRGGIGHARVDLFRSTNYLLIVEPGSHESDATESLRLTLSAIGARVEITTAENHDRAMAFVSHLPQLLSSALAATVDNQIDRECLTKFAGAGYRDMTRLSSSPWNIWRDILATNAQNIDVALGVLIDQLQQVRRNLPQASQFSDEDIPAISALFTRS